MLVGSEAGGESLVILVGTLISVTPEPVTTTVLIDAVVGASVLEVDDASDFEEKAGLLSIDGAELAYSGRDTDAGTIILTDPLVDDVLAGSSIHALSAAGEAKTTWWAWVSLEDDSAPTEYEIRTALVAYFREGDAQAGTLVEVDDVERVVLGRPSVVSAMDLSNAVNVPDPAAVAVDPPEASPAIVRVQGNSAGLMVITEPVLPTTLLDYLIDGVVVAADQRTTITQLTVDGSGDPLVADVDYAVTVQAHNSAGSAVVSAAVNGRIDPGVTAATVLGIVQAGFVLAGAIQVGTSMSFDPAGGFTITQLDGRQTYFRADGSGNQLVGQAILDAATILGNLTILGQTNFLNGLMTLGTGVGDPTSKPGVTTSYDSVPLTWNVGDPDPNTYQRGLFWTGTQWMVTSTVPYFYGVENYSTAGDRNLSDSHPMPGGFTPLGGAVTIGSTHYVLGRDDLRSGNWYVFIFNAGWSKTGEWAPIASSGESLCIGVDGSALLIAKRTGVSTLYVSTYTAGGVESAAVTCGTWPGATLTGVVKAAVDTATVRYVVSSSTSIRVFNTSTGARVSGEEWPAAATPIYGLGHDGTNWHTHDGARIWHYTNLIGTWDFGFTWVDSDAGGTGTAETKVSTLRTLAPTKRAEWTISLPSAPPDDGTTDGANTGSLYAGPTGSTLVRQAALVEPVLSQTFSTLATSGTAPPATSGFATRVGAIGRLVSAAADSAGDPLTDVDGEGGARLAKFAQSGTALVNVTSTGTVFTGSVVFAVPFDTTPAVLCSPYTNLPGEVHATLANVTASGFDIKVKRDASAGTGNTSVGWQATTAS